MADQQGGVGLLAVAVAVAVAVVVHEDERALASSKVVVSGHQTTAAELGGSKLQLSVTETLSAHMRDEATYLQQVRLPLSDLHVHW